LGAALVTITVAGMVAAPQAMAKKAKRVQTSTITEYHHSVTTTSSSNAALEAQLRVLQDEVANLRAQVRASVPAAAVVSADSQKIQELDAWVASVKADHGKHEHHEKHHGNDDNLIFFRGGFARNDAKRDDILTGNQVGSGILGAGKTNQDGYYIGAGFDFGLTDNVWGLVDKTDVMAELMFDYRNFGEKNFAVVNPLGATVDSAVNGGLATKGAAGTANTKTVTVSQFTLGASPKIKFLKGSAFRPWIIPFGLTVNVISPPSNGVTVLNPGMQFGTGAEYAIWKAIKVGADFRYNLTGRSVDGVNTNGLTAGGYLGIGF
ncbi:MAG: hypothetical protein WCG16_06540, partial [Methylococcales bacterium]